ncbi:interferon-induced GTP-binding protein Mx2 [Phaeosphaeriaceae sp. PMI808]|nr:interferon-induced GTP-binding protein Mx2 [Phaeosphaeriaceae sp. PMI808]
MEATQSGLANRAILDKIDRLRELNIKSIELPQLVVLGDQSSGKSSALESLTGFSFPQAPGLCTRYATQITCHREAKECVVVSIIPRQGADAATETKLRGFKRNIPSLDNEALVQIIQDANKVMGIRMTADDTNPALRAFSKDTLKIEINGPEQEHFTVIDVPGIFRVSSPPFTTDNDVHLVRDMVEYYIKNNRTIILAVLPSNVDITTQEILKMAERADPDGKRTMGVLTKPDLVTEMATQKAIKDLVLGKRNVLQLGYCVVKNRSADDQQSSLSKRIADEEEFFRRREWYDVAASGRCGIQSLKTRLSDLLTTISKQEFPKLRADVSKRLDQRRNELQGMGPSRTNHSSQRVYLGRLGSTFQAITQCALNGYYDSEAVFNQIPSLKLITAVTKMNEKFADTFWSKGHKRETSNRCNDGDEVAHVKDQEDESVPTGYLSLIYPDLSNIVDGEDYECPDPDSFNNDSVMDHIDTVYQMNRGPELGTTEKWEPLVLAHVSMSILRVHDYIVKLLAHICPDQQVRTQLWDTILFDELRKAYTRAMEQAHFLLRIERQGRPSTYNHYFNAEVQKKRRDRIQQIIDSNTKYRMVQKEVIQCVPATRARDVIVNKDNTQQIREDILDVLVSYYKVSRKRFVDTICQQVISHFLLEGDKSPLKIFSAEFVMGLEDDQLELIAGEDAGTKRRRSGLESEISNLEAAMRVLRG